MTSCTLLEQGLGFLVQTVPLCYLLYLPFHENEVLGGQKKGKKISVVILVISSFFFMVLNYLTYGSDKNCYYSELYMGAAIVICLALHFLMVKARTSRKIIVYGMLAHYGAVLYTLNGLLMSFMDYRGADWNALPYTTEKVLGMSLLMGLTYPFVWRCTSTAIRENLESLDRHELRRGCGCVLTALASYCIAAKWIPIHSQHPIKWSIIPLIISDAIIYWIFIQETNMIKQKSMVQRQFEIYKFQYEKIIRNIDEYKRFKHDIRHHLNTIGALNAEGRRDEITDYLNRYQKAYAELDRKNMCSDSLTGSILNYYMYRAEELYIRTEVYLKVDKILEYDPFDITVLLGNCLENALEALMKLPEDARVLFFDMQIVNTSLLIRVKNRCLRRNENEKKGLLRWPDFGSTKSHQDSGIGLKNITAIAEKYGGCAEFLQSGEWFEVRIVLPVM